jgi:hypothetical protein
MVSSRFRGAKDAYALGLWCADGYWWSSSIGLSNADPDLIIRFGEYLETRFPADRIRLRVYRVPSIDPDPRVLLLSGSVSICPAFKMKRTCYHLYVNSRPLLREFKSLRENIELMPGSLVAPYIGGRFDGDGSWGTTPRIAYTTAPEAEKDRELLSRLGVNWTSVLHYERAREYCLYLHKREWEKFIRLVSPYSWKLKSGG